MKSIVVDIGNTCILPSHLEQKKRKKKEKAPPSILNSLKEAAGLPVDREDGHWFSLGLIDYDSGQFLQNGELQVTSELILIQNTERTPSV